VPCLQLHAWRSTHLPMRVSEFCPQRHGCFAPRVGIKSIVESLRIPSCMQVILVQSFTDAERSALLAAACAVVYTPTNEHFGIVPLEAMAAGRPVLACNSGGPKETVLHGRTGFLAEPQPKSFAAAMAQLAVSATNSCYCYVTTTLMSVSHPKQRLACTVAVPKRESCMTEWGIWPGHVQIQLPQQWHDLL